MDTKVDPIATGSALAITLAILSALCALAFAMSPDATLNFFSAFMHGLDFTPIRAAAPIALPRVLYGVIGLAVVGFVAGVVFASTYNVIRRR